MDRAPEIAERDSTMATVDGEGDDRGKRVAVVDGAEAAVEPCAPVGAADHADAAGDPVEHRDRPDARVDGHPGPQRAIDGGRRVDDGEEVAVRDHEAVPGRRRRGDRPRERDRRGTRCGEDDGPAVERAAQHHARADDEGGRWGVEPMPHLHAVGREAHAAVVAGGEEIAAVPDQVACRVGEHVTSDDRHPGEQVHADQPRRVDSNSWRSASASRP